MVEHSGCNSQKTHHRDRRKIPHTKRIIENGGLPTLSSLAIPHIATTTIFGAASDEMTELALLQLLVPTDIMSYIRINLLHSGESVAHNFN